MIQIIRGTYGLYENGMVTPKTSKSEPFALSEDKENELIARGIAERVGDTTPTQPEEPQTGIDLPDYDESMKLDALREIAGAYGVDASKMRSKKEIIGALDAALAEMQELETEDDNELGDGEEVDDPLKEQTDE